MPAKAHRTASGMTRTHSRTSSNGSSKPNLGLQLTQKDPAPPRYADNKKRNAHIHHETGGRNTSPFPRNNSTVRVQSKEQLQPAVLRRVQPPAPANAPRASSSKHKVGFTISSPSEGDDDEWVSSESGAATPLHDTDSDRVISPEPTKSPIPRATSHVNGFGAGIGGELATPRARTPPLPRIETVRPTPENTLATSPSHYQVSQKNEVLKEQGQPGTPWGNQPQLPQSTAVPKARSETHSPPRRSPDHTMRRQAITRPPSTHSMASRSDGAGLRPHPLIRAQSYGQSAHAPIKPAPLAPLTTVLDDAVPTQMTTTSSPTSLRAVSPVLSLKTPSASPVFSHPSPITSEAHRQLRRTSTSSARSMGAQSVASSASQQLSRSNHDRQRTISTSSTFAALSSLAMRSTPSPPRTPVQQFTVTFPPADKEGHLESAHPLLPPPYLAAHLTMLEYRNPLAESYDRVIRAKQAL
ncbi:hypothetical protein EIP91_003543 [Steccherinum ochraceum]|uniref:Uncharacterized protein n=1 Tax=Steccherinum ochraceum TaxID=92696 RepID=A0A4V6N748_9APHY|nr:hypothetical protein EIP91_003543 [Steccherinum ochraceum]